MFDEPQVARAGRASRISRSIDVLALALSAALFACSSGTEADAARTHGALSSALTTGTFGVSTACPNGSVLGFENASSWHASSGTLSSSSTHTQGSFSLSVNHPVNYTTIVSSALSSVDPSLSAIDVGSTFQIDFMLPARQPNPYWFGAMQMFISAPSRGVYNQYLGQVELTNLPVARWLTKSFAIPSFVANALHGSTYSDLTLTVVLNVPSAGTGVYLLDNLRVKGASGSSASNTYPNLVCVNNKGSGKYEALFGYDNQGGEPTHLPVGTSNMFSPGAKGQGQLEDYLAIKSDGAFAVVFDGHPLTWSFGGGCAVASSQSPACPSTTCSPSCKTGQQCVGGRCVTECGDGLCAGDESCSSCAADCACAAGQVCFENTCAKPVQCGIGWQCGSGTSFGVSVNCGSCASGSCVNHLCQ